MSPRRRGAPAQVVRRRLGLALAALLLAGAAGAAPKPSAKKSPPRPARAAKPAVQEPSQAAVPWGPAESPAWPEETRGVRIELRGYGGLKGEWGSHTEVDAPLGSGVYRLLARLRSYRDPKAFRGTGYEVSAGLRRLLYHCMIGARYGTKPPNTERHSYRMLQFETAMTFYGFKPGPERPELTLLLWEEEKERAPAPQSLDQRLVTRAQARYTRSDHRVGRGSDTLDLTQHTTQLELRGTWRRRSSLALQLAFHLYDLVLTPQDEAVHLDNVQYAGAPFPIRGWPNQALGLEAWQKLPGPWKLEAGFTHLRLLDGGVVSMAGGGIEYAPRPGVALRLGAHRRRRQGAETREGVSAGFSWRW